MRVIVEGNRDAAWHYDDIAQARAVAEHLATADQINGEDVHIEVVE